jgi:hypothetical protein
VSVQLVDVSSKPVAVADHVFSIGVSAEPVEVTYCARPAGRSVRLLSAANRAKRRSRVSTTMTAQTRMRLIRLWAGVVVCILTVAVSARAADATDVYYTCGDLAPNTWCPYGQSHTYGYTVAHRPNTTMWRCAKLTNPSSGAIYAHRCFHGSSTEVWSSSDGRAPYPNNSILMRTHVANGANANWWAVSGLATY